LAIGGFAIRAAGYDRRTMDIDLLIDTSLDNEARVLKALEILPDKAALDCSVLIPLTLANPQRSDKSN
jgi:predicted nucleotidyltransferase